MFLWAVLAGLGACWACRQDSAGGGGFRPASPGKHRAPLDPLSGPAWTLGLPGAPQLPEACVQALSQRLSEEQAQLKSLPGENGPLDPRPVPGLGPGAVVAV